MFGGHIVQLDDAGERWPEGTWLSHLPFCILLSHGCPFPAPIRCQLKNLFCARLEHSYPHLLYPDRPGGEGGDGVVFSVSYRQKNVLRHRIFGTNMYVLQVFENTKKKLHFISG